MRISYQRYLSFLINSLQKDFSQLGYVSDNLTFGFKEYVYSQMHLGILCHHYNRDIFDIYNIFSWLDKDSPLDENSLKSVLLWYYTDLSLFIRSSAICGCFTNISLILDVSLDLDEVSIEFDKEKDRVLHCIKTGEVTEYSRFIDLTYSELVGFDKLSENPTILNMLVSAIIISRFSVDNAGKIIKMGGVIECH